MKHLILLPLLLILACTPSHPDSVNLLLPAHTYIRRKRDRWGRLTRCTRLVYLGRVTMQGAARMRYRYRYEFSALDRRPAVRVVLSEKEVDTEIELENLSLPEGHQAITLEAFFSFLVTKL